MAKAKNNPADSPSLAPNGGNSDNLDIPAFLRRKGNEKMNNDKPVTAPATSAPAPAKKPKPSHIPMGMSEEEYNAKKAELEPSSKPDAPAKAPKAKKAAKNPRPAAPHGTFKIADWARDNKLDPRHVRRVCRAIKAELSKLYAGGLKYVFDNADEAKVAKLINDGFAAESKKKVTVKTKKTTAKPAAPKTAGKGKSATDAPAPVLDAPTAKEVARDEGEAAVKAFKAAKKKPAKKKT